ncbi:hypothetical protein [Enterococcus sp. DIV0660C]|uniref:hypothetical protein n=1 Tax=Enterococcus sp. DIV0660C TaxID=2230880 RepID=UPI001A8CE89D|nr:hypothetical protein [Enterococcus sp. DIV0660C]MBO0430755.1 hypothetical protein [Enterococcus sp. DIV0660C]
MKNLSKIGQVLYFLVLMVIFELVNTFIINQLPIYIRIILLVIIAWGYETIVSYLFKKSHTKNKE